MKDVGKTAIDKLEQRVTNDKDSGPRTKAPDESDIAVRLDLHRRLGDDLAEIERIYLEDLMATADAKGKRERHFPHLLRPHTWEILLDFITSRQLDSTTNAGVRFALGGN